MKNLIAIFCFLTILFLSPFARGQSTTANLQLQLPAYQQQNWQVPINYDFTQLDLVLGGFQNLPIGSAPAISIGSNWLTGNTSATAILNFVGGYPGQTIRVVCGSGDTFTTLSSSVNISVSGNFSCNSATAIILTLNGTKWIEVGRSGGGLNSPGGSNTAIQFNNSGAFGGDATNFFYTTATHVLTVLGGVSVPYLTSGNCVQAGTGGLLTTTTNGCILTIASGTAVMSTAAIALGACGTTITVAAAGVVATDSIRWSFNAAPTGSNAGLVSWPTVGNVNFAYCPNSAETPAAATINWRVLR